MKPFAQLAAAYPLMLLLLLSTVIVSTTAYSGQRLHAQDLAPDGQLDLGRQGPDQSGGWEVFARGFATRSPVSAGEQINIRVLSVGNARGLAVTYSGNLAAHRPGQLWAKPLVMPGRTLRYQVPESLNDQKLAVRSGAEREEFDRPVSAEPERGAYLLKYQSGRAVLVSIGRRLPRPNRHATDISGGWTVGNMGFASDSNISVRSAITLRVVNAGNDTGLAVTYSGNLSLHEPGKLWLKSEVQDDVTLLYQVPPILANRRLAIRSGAPAGGLDKPKSVEQRENGYRLYYFGGRIIDVLVSNPGRNIGSPGPDNIPGIGSPPAPGGIPGLGGLAPGGKPPRPEPSAGPSAGPNVPGAGGIPGLPPPAKGLDILPSDD
jgi:hypothetical protein